MSSILIVDDEDYICVLFKRVLEGSNYTVQVARSGAEAIRSVKENAPDLVILDVKMSEMDGIEAFKKIKALQPKLKVMMMTGFSVEEKIVEARELGALGCIHKPLDHIQEIVTIVKKALGEKAA